MKFDKIVKTIAQYSDKPMRIRVKLTAEKLGISEGEILVKLADSQLRIIDSAFS